MLFLFSSLLPFFGTIGIISLLSIFGLSAYFYYDIKNRQSLWEKKGIKYVKPKFFLGNWEFFQTKPFVQTFNEMYKAYPDERYHGVYQYTNPILMITDPDLIKQITVRDFDHFVNHAEIVSSDVDPLWAKNLPSSKDDRWRDLRSTLSPSFTGSKMKIMYSLMEECARQFVEYFKKENQEVIELEMKDTLSRYTNDVIASTAFGLECNSLENRNNEFYMMGKDASNFSGFRIFRFVAHSVSPTLCRLFKIRMISPSVSKYFSEIIESTIKTRKEKNIVRPDMIHLLLEAQRERLEKDSSQKGEITLEDISSQAFIFFLAGFETVSTCLYFAFYELALNPQIQNRLREEIQEVSGEITYETLQGLKYLDMVICEILRKWSPNIVTDRQVTRDFTIEPVKPGEKPLFLKKGLLCWLPIFPIHNDPKYYPEPEKFDPERFNEENIHMINPGTYLPFGIGPRNCIGSRFATLKCKLIIYYVLKNFEVVITEKTQVPLILDKKQIHFLAEGGMGLGLKRI